MKRKYRTSLLIKMSIILCTSMASHFLLSYHYALNTPIIFIQTLIPNYHLLAQILAHICFEDYAKILLEAVMTTRISSSRVLI